jgi:hypothetical protein
MVITTDPPGMPVRFNGQEVGHSPVVVEEREAFAIHEVTVGEGSSAVTEIVPASRVLAKDGASALAMPVAYLILPFWFTAGTDDRVHIATRLSGEPIGGGIETDFPLEYLAEDASYPNGVQIERQIVAGKPARVIVERRPFITTVNYQGLTVPLETTRMYPEPGGDVVRPPILSFGLEQEWLPTARIGLGFGGSYRAFEGAVVGAQVLRANTDETRDAPRAGFDEVRMGPLVRYRHPLLHWDGVAGGLDFVTGAGAELGVQMFFNDRDDESQTRALLFPWVEAGFDVGITRALAVFAVDRLYPLNPADAGDIWGNLGGTAEQRVILGVRLFW